MRNKTILLSSIAALTLLSTTATAESTQLETVDVWETEVTSSSLNLGENAIETKQADHLSDLLKGIPGVDVGGTHSINNRINIRGLQDENLDITLDGAKIQNANMFHHIGNLLINPDILKKVNIQVGTNSVVNGSLGGAVEFETKDAQDLLGKGETYGARVQTNYNSNQNVGGSITGYTKVGANTDFMMYYNHVKKGNWTDGRGVETFGVEGDIFNVLGKVGHNISDTQRISLSYDFLKDEGDYVPRPDFGRDYNESRTGLSTYDTQYMRNTITLKHELDLGESLVVNTTVYSNENELERYEKNDDGSAVRPGKIEGLLNGKVKTEGITIKAQSNIETGDILNTLTYGALYDKQSSKVTYDGAKYGEDEFAKTFALYIEDAIDFDNGLILTPGIRYNHYDFDGSYGNIKDNTPTYGLAVEYAVNDSLTLLASATTLYKGVEMVDVLATNRIGTNNNTDLKSETGINREVGFTYTQNNAMGADFTGFSFKYFHTTINDYIENNYIGGGAFEMVNSGELELKGFEASFIYDIGNLNSLLSYAHSSSNFEQTGEPVVSQPGDSISLKLDYQVIPTLSLSWQSLVVLEEEDVPSGGDYQIKEAYDVHDIAANWKPSGTKGLTLIAGIDNIFDKAYASHISMNRIPSSSQSPVKDYEPGRSFKVTLAYKF